MQTDATMLANNSQHCWMLNVASVCTPCCILLDVVAQSLKPVKLFSQQLPTFLLFHDHRERSATMLDPLAQLLQHCWDHARSLRMDYKDLWVVFFPRCTAGPKLVGNCCIRLHTTANTNATIPNMGATMLGVARSLRENKCAIHWIEIYTVDIAIHLLMQNFVCVHSCTKGKQVQHEKI